MRCEVCGTKEAVLGRGFVVFEAVDGGLLSLRLAGIHGKGLSACRICIDDLRHTAAAMEDRRLRVEKERRAKDAASQDEVQSSRAGT